MKCQGILALFPMALLCGCSGVDTNDVATRFDAVESQKGRWQLIAQTAPNPVLIFDTATGCVQTLERIPDGEKAGQLAVYDTYGNEGCGTTLDLQGIERLIEAQKK